MKLVVEYSNFKAVFLPQIMWKLHRLIQKINLLFISFLFNPYILHMYILDRNSMLPSHSIYVKFFNYILIILICVNFPLNSKMKRCWDLLESSPSRIPLIGFSHKWTWILFIISKYKLVIWFFSQTIVDVIS